MAVTLFLGVKAEKEGPKLFRFHYNGVFLGKKIREIQLFQGKWPKLSHLLVGEAYIAFADNCMVKKDGILLGECRKVQDLSRMLWDL